MSYDNTFTKVVNTNVQTTSILNSIAAATSALAPLAGTYFQVFSLTPSINNIILTDDNLASIRSSSTLFITAPNIIIDSNLSVGDDTAENAKRLINLFDLNENVPIRLITIVLYGTNPNSSTNKVYLGTNETALQTYEHVIFDIFDPTGNSNPFYKQVIATENSYKNGYFSVSLTDVKDTIKFTIIQAQIS